jgi:hypothetical protein
VSAELFLRRIDRKVDMAMKTMVSPRAQSSSGDIELLTEIEVAEALKITPGALRNARVSGSLGLPFIKLTPGKRGAVRYRRSEVSTFLDNATAMNTRQARGEHADMATVSGELPADEGTFFKWALSQKEGQ